MGDIFSAVAGNQDYDEYLDSRDRAAITDDAVPASQQQAIDQGVAALKNGDHLFDVQQFLGLAETAFMKVKLAWQSRDMSLAGGYLADNLSLQLEQQVRDMTHEGVRNVLEGLAIQDRHIAHVDPGDEIAVRFDAIAAHYALDSGGNVVFGDRVQHPFTEYWTFSRPRGSQSYSSEATNCVNCGAPLQVDDAGRCHWCRAVYASGTLGWRVTDIRDDVVWTQ